MNMHDDTGIAQGSARNADDAELARFAALAPRWWSSASRLRDALKRIARDARGSGRDAGRTTRQGRWAAPEWA